MSAPLLTTKLYIPPARASRVARPHLLALLDEGLQPGRRLILVSAPAGFGKTSLLSEWIARAAGGQARFGWLSLDEGDNDTARFLRYLVAALQTACPALGQPALALLQAPVGTEGLVSTEGVLNALLNELAEQCSPPGADPAPLCLVLDDYHMIERPEVHDAVSYLIDHLPPRVYLVIATRSDPPLPFSRLRARDQITELRVADLRFSPQEAAAFLNEVMQLDLSAEDVAALEARTEGWIAGLQLASLAARATPDRASVASFVTAFAGSNRYIFDYLVEEVLASQPAAVQNFLLQTAVLERMCAELCEEVVGRTVNQSIGEQSISRSGSSQSEWKASSSLITDRLMTDRLSSAQCQEMLETLERSNLFIVPLDGERRWYRYHNLFAEFLYNRLCATLAQRPLAQRQLGDWQAQVRELHRRASGWFERQDLAYEAIEHALRAEDYARAAALIESKARWAVLTPGETGKMLRWLEAIPDDIALAHPGLCLTHAWVLLSAGYNPAAEQSVEEALAAITAHPEGYDPDEIRSEAAALRSLLAVMAGRLEEATGLAQQALDRLPESALVLRGMVALNLGLAYDMRGDVASAAPVYRQAVALGQATDNLLIMLIAAVQLADLELLQGRMRQAEASYRQAVQLAGKLGGLPVAAMAHSGLGHLLYEQNRLDEAATQLEKAIELGRRWESTDIMDISLAYLAQLRLAQGRREEALALVDQAAAGLLGNLSSPSTTPSTRAQMARVWLRAGRMDEAALWATAFQEKTDGFPHAYLRVIEGATLARVRLAQGQPGQAAEAAARLLPDAQPGEAIELNTLLALALQCQGHTDAAIQALYEALTRAEAEGYARVFIDEGAQMAGLLRLALARKACPDYTKTLLDAFDPAEDQERARETTTRQANRGLVEPLSDREMEVLRLVAEGLSNQAIARRLVVAVSTVKTHINNIYGKLGAQTRTQAVTLARDLRLLV